MADAKRYILLSAFISGLAVATKVSSLIFLALPIVLLLSTFKEVGIVRAFFRLVLFGVMTAFFAIVFSPHNIISFSDFISALHYESAVGLGTLDVFYTKQFFQTVPVLFQLIHIFPYVLGLPVLIGGIGGLFFLPYRRPLNVLRFAFLLYFISTASLYAKWTRFIAPTFPILIIFAILFLFFVGSKLFNKIVQNKLLTASYLLLATLFCIPGWAFLSIYLTPDVRFIASVWMAKNIPVESSSILTETANVVDLPIAPYGLDSIQYQQIGVKNISFNFYDLDANPFLQQDLQSAVQSSTYLVIPSRRVFKNYTCIDEQTFRHSGEDPDVT